MRGFSVFLRIEILWHEHSTRLGFSSPKMSMKYWVRGFVVFFFTPSQTAQRVSLQTPEDKTVADCHSRCQAVKREKCHCLFFCSASRKLPITFLFAPSNSIHLRIRLTHVSTLMKSDTRISSFVVSRRFHLTVVSTLASEKWTRF